MIIEDNFQELLFYIGNNHKDLNTVNLAFEVIGDQGINALAGVLGNNQTLQALELSSVHMSFIGAMNLANAISKNTNLRYLGLACNQIGDAGAQAIFNALKTTNKLEILSLMQNQISDAVVPNIVHCLTHNQTLKSINLDNNHLSNTGLDKIAEALRTNFSLLQFHFRNNTGITKDANLIIAQIKHCLKRNKKIARIKQDLENNLDYIQSLDQKMQNMPYNLKTQAFEKNYIDILVGIEHQIVNGINELQNVGYPGAQHLMDRWYLFCATGYPKLNRLTQAQILEEVATTEDSPYRLDALHLLGQLHYFKMHSHNEEGEIKRLLKSHVYFKHAANTHDVSEGILNQILRGLVSVSENIELSPHKIFYNSEYQEKLQKIQQIINDEEAKLKLNVQRQSSTTPKQITFLFDQSRQHDKNEKAIPMDTALDEDIKMVENKTPIQRFFSSKII